MSKSIVLDKHEMVIDKEDYDKFQSLITFAKWCASENFDYDEMRSYTKELVGI